MLFWGFKGLDVQLCVTPGNFCSSREKWESLESAFAAWKCQELHPVPELSKHTRTRWLWDRGSSAHPRVQLHPAGCTRSSWEEATVSDRRNLEGKAGRTVSLSGGQETTEKVTSLKEELDSELELLAERARDTRKEEVEVAIDGAS